MTMATQSAAFGPTVFEGLGFFSVLWLLVAAFVLHEAEEWRITAFETRNFVGLTPTVTTENGRAWLVFICGVAAAWCAAATLPGSPRFAAIVFLPAVGLALANALQHVFWTIYFRQYAPGVVTAALLLLPLSIYVFARATLQELVPLWYLAAVALSMAVIVAHTVRSGKRMTAPIRAIYAVGDWLSRNVARRGGASCARLAKSARPSGPSRRALGRH
jgi:hypothetical protein